MPCVSIFCNFILMCMLDDETLVLFAIIQAVGILIYFVYGMHNSKLE